MHRLPFQSPVYLQRPCISHYFAVFGTLYQLITSVFDVMETRHNNKRPFQGVCEQLKQILLILCVRKKTFQII